MKKLICNSVLIIFLFQHNLYSQKPLSLIKPDSRLYSCFESSFVNDTLMSKPEVVFYFNYFLKNSYFIVENDSIKPSTDVIELSQVDVIDKGKKFRDSLYAFKNVDLDKFNVLFFNCTPDYDKYVIYKLGITGKLLIFYPRSVFLRRYYEYKKSSGYQFEDL